MTKKLLQKTSRVYLVFSVLILLGSAPLFYYFTERLYIQEADETLLLHKKEFMVYSMPGLSVKDIPVWNKYNRDLKINPAEGLLRDTIFYTSYVDALEDENEPYRELNAPVWIEGKPFTLLARMNLVESEDLQGNIAILFFALLFLLLAGIFLITKRLSGKLWKPFYDTLLQIGNFEIDQEKQPHFSETGTEEFNRLNQSIGKLIEKNTLIYKSQREFIENAAHELQTPLAVFQARIDTLIQREDVTAGQSEILGALNENVARMNRLNRNLLMLSKIENENYSGKQVISLNDSIEKQLEFFTEQAKAKNLQLNIGIDETLSVQSNPALAEMLVSNLFLNAVRHNRQDGELNVLISGRTLVFSNTGQQTALAPEKLFNRFSKSNPSEHGNGLGLAIVKRIADLNQWQITYAFKNNLHYFSVEC